MFLFSPTFAKINTKVAKFIDTARDNAFKALIFLIRKCLCFFASMKIFCHSSDKKISLER